MAQDQASDPLPDGAIRIHASCAELNGRAALFTGASGSGKSSQCLALIALGATLVSDDQVVLTRDGTDLIAAAAPGIEGMIEARGLGILKAKFTTRARIVVVVDMDTTELQRLPPMRTQNFHGVDVPKINGRENAFLAPSLLTLLAGNRIS